MAILKHNISLSKYTSWRVGGVAEQLFQPDNLQELTDFFKSLPADTPITWLGLGSNVLVRDAGVKGVVIVTFPGLNKLTQINENTIYAEVGVACAQAARFSARANLSGLEFLAGVPGTIGGALAMNAGCFGGETWGVVSQVETIDRQGERHIREPAEFAVSYRQVEFPKQEWFVAAEFKLAAGDKAQSLEKIRSMLARRNQTQPTNKPSCGSVFRNPPNDYAARLIEACALKGFSIGGAKVSEKHANFIINDKQATAADIEKLIQHIEQRVLEKQGIQLQREVRILGA